MLLLRAPRLLFEGRIYAEEGTTYLRYAWNATPVRAFLAPHQGYYSLLDNLCALIAARVLPLTAAALFFTWVAAAVQLLVLFLAIQCEVWRTTRERWAAMFALLFVTPNFETWLSLEMCQFILAIAAALILISSTRRFFALRTATLFLAGLTSLTPVPLLPLFWLRAWQQRSRRAVIYALSLTVPAVLQAILLLQSLRSGDRPVRPHHLRDLITFASSRVIFLPFTTVRGTWIYDRFLVNHPGPGALLGISLVCLALIAGGFLLFARTSHAALALYCGALLCTAFNWYGCAPCTFDRLQGWPLLEGRYFLAANAMLLLAWLLAATRVTPRWLARASGTAFVWLLFTGLMLFVRTRYTYNNYPAWVPQVRHWQTDEQQPIIVGPDFWRINPLFLPHRHRNQPDLPFSGYDSSTRHPVFD